MMLLEADKTDTLCSRCESLGLYNCHRYSNYPATVISVASLQMNCVFCTLLHQFVNSCSDVYQTERLDNVMLLDLPEKSKQNVTFTLAPTTMYSENPHGTENLWYLPNLQASYSFWYSCEGWHKRHARRRSEGSRTR
jgi:hypothetical protein